MGKAKIYKALFFKKVCPWRRKFKGHHCRWFFIAKRFHIGFCWWCGRKI